MLTSVPVAAWTLRSRSGIEALGPDTLLEAASIFAQFDQDGDGRISAREGMRMKTELLSILPAGNVSLMPNAGKSLDFVEFCRRLVAQSAASVSIGNAASEHAIAEESAELLRTFARDDARGCPPKARPPATASSHRRLARASDRAPSGCWNFGASCRH